jgi:CRP/FNR family transcriptional regulator
MAARSAGRQSHAMPLHATIPAARGPQAPSQVATRCTACHLRSLCLPCGMNDEELKSLDRLPFGRRRIRTGEVLYREGDRFGFVYAVRNGTYKATLTLPDGREQVTGFYIGGELMGMDGVAQSGYGTTATALEDSEVCAIPYAELSELARGSAGMQQRMARLMGREIVREHGLMLLLGSMNAQERLGAFLLNLSRRNKARGYSASEFHLRMTRAEIGSCLGLTLETVSRTFSSLQQQGLLEVDKRHIRILDLERLARSFETCLY